MVVLLLQHLLSAAFWTGGSDLTFAQHVFAVGFSKCCRCPGSRGRATGQADFNRIYAPQRLLPLVLMHLASEDSKSNVIISSFRRLAAVLTGY